MRPHLLALPLALSVTVALLAFPGSASAQDAISDVEQSEDYTFGQALHFTIEAQATTVFTKAQLTLKIANQPGTIVATPEVPRSAQLSLTHEVAVTEDIPPFAEVTYQWELATFGGATHTTEPHTFRYEDTSVSWTWQEESRDPLIVHWDGESEEVAQTALSVAEESLAQTDELLGTTTTEDIHIYIYPDLNQLTSSLRLHNRNMQDWVAALAIPDQSVILLSAAAGPELSADLSRDLPHELTHILVYRAAGSNAEGIPGWYNEGLAITSSNEPDEALRVALEDGEEEGQLLPLESLCAASYASMQPAEAALAYAQSESVMRYIIDRFGSVGVRNLRVAYADGASCQAGVERALGLSLAELESDWLADLRRDMLTQSGAESSLLPWLLLWGYSFLASLLFLAPQGHAKESPIEPAETPPVPDAIAETPDDFPLLPPLP